MDTGTPHLLSQDTLYKAINRIASGKRFLCAVAFWGSGAEELIGDVAQRDVRLICNLKMGGTNPRVVEEIIKRGASVRQCDTLHSKVYIGDELAMVTSANASGNGLGLADGGISGWIEAGVVITASSAISWFEHLWTASIAIVQPDDIDKALLQFIRHELAGSDSPDAGLLLTNPSRVTETFSQNERLQTVFKGLSVRRAVVLTLSLNGHVMSGADIAEQLRAGGLETAASSLGVSVHDALRDGQRYGLFVNAARGKWGLSAWPEYADIGARLHGPRPKKKRSPSERAESTNQALSARVLAGLAAARERGVIGGKPKKLTSIQEGLVIERIIGGARARDVANEFGCALNTVKRIAEKNNLVRRRTDQQKADGPKPAEAH